MERNPKVDDLEDSEENEDMDAAEKDDRLEGVIRLLPVQDAPRTGKNDLTVKRGRGRPRKVERMPTTTDLEYHAEMLVEKDKFIKEDPLVSAVAGRAEPIDVLRLVKAQIAEECAALHFQRLENEKRGRDTAQVSTRRIESLKKIADIEFEMRKLGADSIDLKSERFQRVFVFLIQILRETAEQTLPPEQIEVFFNRLESALHGWEEKAAEVAK